MNSGIKAVLTAVVVCGLVHLGSVPAAGADDDAGFVNIFNGKDLSEWQGDPKVWSVRDGLITAQTVAGSPIKENSYLIWQGGEVQDFELRLSYRLENGNSGIYCRAKVRAADDKGQDPIIAWQADIDDKHE